MGKRRLASWPGSCDSCELAINACPGLHRRRSTVVCLCFFDGARFEERRHAVVAHVLHCRSVVNYLRSRQAGGDSRKLRLTFEVGTAETGVGDDVGGGAGRGRESRAFGVEGRCLSLCEVLYDGDKSEEDRLVDEVEGAGASKEGAGGCPSGSVSQDLLGDITAQGPAKPVRVPGRMQSVRRGEKESWRGGAVAFPHESPVLAKSRQHSLGLF